MAGLKDLINEAHRRSLWQVLGIYLMVSWIVIQVVETLTESAGLPDWVPPFALVLLLVGLPVVMATAFVQEGMGGVRAATSEEPPAAPPVTGSGTTDASPAPQPAEPNLAHGTGSLDRPTTSGIARFLTWKHAMIGGVLAFAGLGVLVTSYWFMWATGVGPVGSLVAQGVLEESEPIILAEFENGTADPLMSDLVTSTLRVDLVESPVISLVEPRSVQNVLQRMGRDSDERITSELAQEIAIREGLKAVIEGEVRSAGSQVIITATILAAETGQSLAAFRVSADDEAGIVAAIDELSQDIRERAGESLRSIRAGVPLEDVTTTSLESLKKFTEADQLFNDGDALAALALLEDAVELDPEFAMAYRRIAVITYNENLDRVQAIEAATKAYELGNRLSDRERYLAEAYYHEQVTGNREASIQAYRTVLRSHPDDPSALNNLANQYIDRDDEAALELFQSANQGPGESNTSNSNVVRLLLMMSRFDEAATAHERYAERYPNDFGVPGLETWVHFFRGEFEEADRVALALASNPAAPAGWQAAGHGNRWSIALIQGRLAAAKAHALATRRANAELGPAQEFGTLLGPAFNDVYLGLDATASFREIEEASPVLDDVPAVSRPYLVLALLYAVAGQSERAEGFLEDWETEVPEDYRTDEGESLRMIVEGLIAHTRGDAAAGLELLDRGRDGMDCERCWLFERASMIEDMGTPAQAIAAWEARANTVEGNFGANALEWPLAYEKLCHLHAQQGEATSAVQYCSRFVEIWADADAALQPRVRAAQERLDVLTEG